MREIPVKWRITVTVEGVAVLDVSGPKESCLAALQPAIDAALRFINPAGEVLVRISATPR